ncbi:M48 family metallopeptidase [Pacificispira sp.]|uniref:M48 family metallopeptidase n=1 Tax=Pacificispira sp. TaxID=2888761 RepID=UPI003BAB08FE
MASSAVSDRPGRTPHRVSGRLFAAGSSAFIEASVEFGVGSVCLIGVDGNLGAIRSLTEVTIDRPVVGLPRRLRFPGGEVFESDDHEMFEAALAYAEGRSKRKSGALGLGPVKLIALAVLAVLLPVGVFLAMPYAADGVARALPRSIDKAIGASAFEEMDGRLFRGSRLAPKTKSDLNRLFREIVDASALDPDDVRLRLRMATHKGLNENAIALPDGTIVLFDGLVEIAENEDELAGVLAHEIGHIEHRHSLRQAVRAAGLGLLVTIFVGDSASLLEELAAAGVFATELSYSREFETEADVTSARIMRRLGRDPEAMVFLLRRLHSDCNDDCEESGFWSTHPGLRERMESVGAGTE